MVTNLPNEIQRSTSLHGLLMRCIDVGSIFAGLVVASRLWRMLGTDQLIIAGLAATIAFFTASGLFATYRQWRGARLANEVANSWMAWLAALVGLIVLGAITNYGSGISRMSFVIWTLATAFFFGLTRWLVRITLNHLYEKGFNQRGFAVVGVTKIGVDLTQNILDTPQLGLKLVGFYDDRPADRTEELPDHMGERLGNVDELVERTRNCLLYTSDAADE